MVVYGNFVVMNICIYLGTCHNSGSRSPFDTLTSALGMIFQAPSITDGFRARFLPNNAVLDTEKRENIFATIICPENLYKIHFWGSPGMFSGAFWVNKNTGNSLVNPQNV